MLKSSDKSTSFEAKLTEDLFKAVKEGNMAALQWLLSDNDRDLNSIYSPADNQRLIDTAAFYGQIPVMRYLIARGIDPSIPNPETNLTTMHYAAWGGKIRSMIFLNQDELIPPHQRLPFNIPVSTSLFQNAWYYKYSDAYYEKGATPMHFSARGNHIKAMLFLNRGREVPITQRTPFNVTNSNGITPMHFAAEEDHIQLMIFLSQSEIIPSLELTPVNVTDKNGITPMHCAARKDRRNVMIFLYEGTEVDKLKQKTVFNVKSKTGEMPFHFAGWSGHIETIFFLSREEKIPVEHRTSFDEKDNLGSTIFHYAVARNNFNLIMQFAEKGVSFDAMNVENNYKYTPRSFALKLKRNMCIKSLDHCEKISNSKGLQDITKCSTKTDVSSEPRNFTNPESEKQKSDINSLPPTTQPLFFSPPSSSLIQQVSSQEFGRHDASIKPVETSHQGLQSEKEFEISINTGANDSDTSVQDVIDYLNLLPPYSP